MKIEIKNWNIVRVIRLVLGVLMVVQGFSWQNAVIAIAGGVIAASTILNIDCLGIGSCSVNNARTNKSVSSPAKEVSYEEADVSK